MISLTPWTSNACLACALDRPYSLCQALIRPLARHRQAEIRRSRLMLHLCSIAYPPVSLDNDHVKCIRPWILEKNLNLALQGRGREDIACPDRQCIFMYRS